MKVDGTGAAALTYTLVAGFQRLNAFLLLPFVTHATTTDEYGQIALLVAVAGLTNVVLGFGLETPVYRAALGLVQREAAEQLRACALFLRIAPVLVASACAGLLLTRAEWGAVPSRALALQVLGCGLLVAATLYPFARCRAGEQLGRYVALALTTSAVQLILRYVFVVLMEAGSIGWATADIAAALVALPLGLVLAAMPKVDRLRAENLRQPLKLGLPLVPHLVSHWVLALSDRLVLAAFLPLTRVAVYAAAYQFASVAAVLLTEINRAVMPAYARTAKAPSPTTALRRIVTSHLSVSVTLLGLVATVSSMLIPLVLPPGYRQAGTLAPMLAVALLPYVFYQPLANIRTLVRGQTRGLWLASGSAAAVNILTNLALVPVIGAWGAVAATFAAYAVLHTAMQRVEMRSAHAAALRRYPLLPGVVGPLFLALLACGLSASSLGTAGAIAATACVALGGLLSARLVLRRPIGQS